MNTLRFLAGALALVAAAPIAAQQTPIVTPNPTVTNLPGPVPFTGAEWMNFRQKEQPVTAPVATVLGQATMAAPAVTTLTGAEQLPVVQGGTTKVTTTAATSFLAGVGDKITAPTTGPSVAVGAAGALTGTYTYGVAYVTANGTTAPWPGTPPQVTVSSQQVSVTNIPVGPAGVTARLLYRSKPQTASTDVKDFYLVATIADNTTTTFTDNVADGSLGAPANWGASNRGYLTDGLNRFAMFADQSTAFGQGAGAMASGSTSGYANSSFGYQALYNNTSGRRNSGFGIYALTSVTTGYENVGLGAHAGNYLTTQNGNVFAGTYAGFQAGITGGTGGAQHNVGVGRAALYGGSGGIGSNNTAVGYYAGGNINTADSVIALGAYAGNFANASQQVFIDNVARASLADEMDQGLMYGKTGSLGAPQGNELRANARVRLGWDPNLALVANLPAATTAMAGFHAWVKDANAAYNSTNLGTTVAGGGSNVVPVFCTGTAWVIGG